MINRALQAVERIGNRLPEPTWLFACLCVFIVVLSAVAQGLGWSASHPVNHTVVVAKSLISVSGLHWMLQNTVANFTQFAPVGTVLVAVLGLGVAEQSGLMGAILRQTVAKAPANMLSFIVVLAGVLSSLAADAGYVVLIPIAAMLFAASGRSPLLGIAAAFAGVSGGYSANLLVGPLDAVLAGISTESIALVDPEYQVGPLSNYYFMVVSTFVVALVCTWVTEKVVAPRFINEAVVEPNTLDGSSILSPLEKKALRRVVAFSVLFLIMLLIGLVPEQGVLRSASGSIVKSPFISGIVTVVAVYAAIAGVIYGRTTGLFKGHRDTVASMNQSMQTMASYLVLMFFAAQFVNYFKWTDLGVIAAIRGAEGLSAVGLGGVTTLVLFVPLAGLINLLIGSASAKWALMAPIFIPMFYLLGIAPEATQLAYRIGDSSTNIITPLMPYFGVVVAFAQRYKADIGVGTLISTMLPYSIALLLSWSVMLAVWLGFGWPLGI